MSVFTPQPVGNLVRVLTVSISLYSADEEAAYTSVDTVSSKEINADTNECKQCKTPQSCMAIWVRLSSVIRSLVFGLTSKFNFCGPRFPYSLSESKYIVWDFCRSPTELSWFVYIALYSNPTPLTDGGMGFLGHVVEIAEKVTNISLKRFVALSGEF